MRTITCPKCKKELAGNYQYEVRCYHCGKYSYLTEALTFAEEKDFLLAMVSQYSYAYVPKKVREYVDKYGLAQSGPTTLKWFRDHDEEAQRKMKSFIDGHVTAASLQKLHQEHNGTMPFMPFLLFILDHLAFPIERASLEWNLDVSDSCDF